MKTVLPFVLCLLFNPSFADEVRIPVGEQSDIATVAKPARGITTAAVEQKFGSPLNRVGPIGDPAIHYWEYKDFTVYFEKDYVIHAVSKFKSKMPMKK